MKKEFNGYTYYGPINKNYKSADEYAFNSGFFNKLMTQRRFSEAVDYLKLYHFKDHDTQRAHEADIARIEREGNIINTIYKNITDSKIKAFVEFGDAIFQNNGVESLLSSDNEESRNLASQFIKKKRSFLSELNDDGSIKNEAVKLGVTFKPGDKLTNDQRLKLNTVNPLISLGYNLINKNDNTIDAFYERSGLTKGDLQIAGVEVIEKDGNTTLMFDKSNELSNKILFNLYKPLETLQKQLQNPYYILFNGINKYNDIVGYDNKGNKLNTGVTAEELQSMIKAGVDAKDEEYNKNISKTYDASSILGPILTDGIEQLNYMLDNGLISESDYNKEWNRNYSKIFSTLYGLGPNQRMYTDIDNKEEGDMTLVESTGIDKSKLLARLQSTSKNDISVAAMANDGEFGILVTLKGAINEDGSMKRQPIKIFMPGLLVDEVQNAINSDTYTQAALRYDDMNRWGFDYTFVDNSKIEIQPDGSFMKVDKNGNKTEIDKDSIIKQINKDLVKRNSADNLKYQYTNVNDELINYDGYEAKTREIAISTANELWPDVPLVSADGKPYSPDDIFSYRALQEDDYVNDAGESVLTDMQYKKVSDIFDIYNYIMNSISYYLN